MCKAPNKCLAVATVFPPLLRESFWKYLISSYQLLPSFCSNCQVLQSVLISTNCTWFFPIATTSLKSLSPWNFTTFKKSWTNLLIFSFSMKSLFWPFNINISMQYVFFCDWFISACLEVHTCCSMNQYFFCGGITVHCMDKPHLIYPFVSWSKLRLFLLFGYFK